MTDRTDPTGLAPMRVGIFGRGRLGSAIAQEVQAAFVKWVRPDGFVQVTRGPNLE